MTNINESDVLQYLQAASKRSVMYDVGQVIDPFAAPHVGPYYSLSSENLRPLSDFRALLEDLLAISQSNGDIALRLAMGKSPCLM